MSTPGDNFATHFETLKLDDRTLQVGATETIVPEVFRRNLEHVDVLRTLPRLGTSARAGAMVDLELVGTLGEGGMGLVRLARQVALDRDVAVKTLRSGGDENAPKLLQEAYVTGRLEHPNIVPIYTLGRDDEDAPPIVMKRIEGVSWLDVMRDPARAPGDARADLGWHLEILLQVCNAVRFAHRHHVIHRDIKPENVMIGLYGEVYLLDWGIAVSIAPDPAPSDPLPHRDAVVGMAGTPAYMAPEMTNDSAADQNERTDIYLLGACLHEVLTGEPRHGGTTLFEVMRSAFESKPVQYDASVPAELGAIANRATALDPADRYETVEELRAALLSFLEHRGALELIAEAEQLLAGAMELAASPDLDEREVEIHDLFTECGFACQQALRSWPDSEVGLAVYERYLRRRFDYAVSSRDLVQARGMIAQLQDRELDAEDERARLGALVAERDSEREELRGLRALADELDLSRGRLSRSAAVIAMGVMWSANTIISWWVQRSTPGFDYAASYVSMTWRVMAIGAICILLFRKQLFSNAANRKLGLAMTGTIVAIGVFRLVFVFRPGDVMAARSFEIVMYGVAALNAGLLADDRRIAALGVLYFPIAVLGAYLGPDIGLILGLMNFVMFVGAGYFWTPRQLEKRIPI